VVPRGADADVLDQASNESVRIRESSRYRCSGEGIEVKAYFKVKPTLRQATGTQVAVSINVDGESIGESAGTVRQWIGVDAWVPVDDPSCADNQQDDETEDEDD
jgi:hypothetical protein